MARSLFSLCLVAILAGSVGTATMPAGAQPYHHHHGSGHFHYTPGHLHYHNGHFDYHPGQWNYHGSGHGHGYYPSQPNYIVPVQPTYISPPQTSYYGGHSQNHVQPQITYGGFSHIDDLAVTLERQANALCLELHYNYQHNPGYRQTYREAYEILTTAKYIHGLEHAGNRDKLRQAVGELDQLFHHVENDVAHWTAHHHRRVGHGGLTTKLEDLEETLHHLMDDVGVRPTASGSPAPLGPPAPAEGPIGFPS